MLAPRGREEGGLISLLCVLPVLLVLICAGIADADLARIVGDWSYDIRAQDLHTGTDIMLRNAGPISGLGDIGGATVSVGPFVSFDIVTNGVLVGGHFSGCEIEIPCSLFHASFSIDDGTVAISGVGNGGARGDNQSAGFGVVGNIDLLHELDVSFPGSDTAVLFEARAVIAGSAARLVSEPADSAFLALCLGLAALYSVARGRLSCIS
jgi:hypothetical protein